MSKPGPTHSELLRLSLDGAGSPNTLKKLLRGEPVRGWAGVRAREALERAGFKVPTQPKADGAASK